MPHSFSDLIYKAYDAFNKRDIDAVLSIMDEQVHWPNGWEGGYVEGHDGVRGYWTRQWKELNPMVTPISIKQTKTEEAEVAVHQVVKDMEGNVVYDGVVKHIYTFAKDKIKSMEIAK